MKYDLKKECECLIDKSTTSIMEHDLKNIVKEIQVAKYYIERKSAHNVQADVACDPCSWIAEYNNTYSASIEIIRAKVSEQ